MCSVEEEERNGVLRALYARLVGMVTLIAAGGKAYAICSQIGAAKLPPGLVVLQQEVGPQGSGQGWGLLPAPLPPSAPRGRRIKDCILQNVSSRPQNYSVPYTPLKRSCMSNHLNECYIIYNFRYY